MQHFENPDDVKNEKYPLLKEKTDDDTGALFDPGEEGYNITD